MKSFICSLFQGFPHLVEVNNISVVPVEEQCTLTRSGLCQEVETRIEMKFRTWFMASANVRDINGTKSH